MPFKTSYPDNEAWRFSRLLRLGFYRNGPPILTFTRGVRIHNSGPQLPVTSRCFISAGEALHFPSSCTLRNWERLGPPKCLVWFHFRRTSRTHVPEDRPSRARKFPDLLPWASNQIDLGGPVVLPRYLPIGPCLPGPSVRIFRGVLRSRSLTSWFLLVRALSDKARGWSGFRVDSSCEVW